MKAEALFKRHFPEFWKRATTLGEDTRAIQAAAIIYGACITAEAIRNEMDEADFKTPEGGI